MCRGSRGGEWKRRGEIGRSRRGEGGDEEGGDGGIGHVPFLCQVIEGAPDCAGGGGVDEALPWGFSWRAPSSVLVRSAGGEEGGGETCINVVGG
uniref:Uncharacterized protein n=1 Tax=Chromera velia CCMP2878 TaxID=1169474 RepID=A0A0G4F3U1_9ALVE|eukprot:Cvel_15012.t1-p1 / transcript=Cvel_15012.t1 / gene=Cvel_15012 / organism=Chromera_velia_CCMP2878 / gene_product=hypothetical protein / transcript_product=hypothetical protein / location=Cvel_scaffold1092:48467-49498(-) / protein_length=93 / sequence_SO=supercontig / SO=protein_coding / is_pseudo=false